MKSRFRLPACPIFALLVDIFLQKLRLLLPTPRYDLRDGLPDENATAGKPLVVSLVKEVYF